jgi:hypothetical protein
VRVPKEHVESGNCGAGDNPVDLPDIPVHLRRHHS